VFRAIAALALASASALTTPTLASTPTRSASAHAPAVPGSTLDSTSPWWERVTVTVNDDGQTQSCRFETSLRPASATDCSVVGGEATLAKASSSSSGAKDQVTRITFERRFSPDATPELTALHPGDVLLGRQTLALGIDGAGAVKHCRVVGTSGPVAPQYGCSEASAERFQASAGAHSERQGYLTVLVYGHSEHVV
jgi:hypothetical protein